VIIWLVIIIVKATKGIIGCLKINSTLFKKERIFQPEVNPLINRKFLLDQIKILFARKYFCWLLSWNLTFPFCWSWFQFIHNIDKWKTEEWISKLMRYGWYWICWKWLWILLLVSQWLADISLKLTAIW